MPLAVVLSPASVVEPDLVHVAADRAAILTDRGSEAPVSLPPFGGLAFAPEALWRP